MHRSLLVGRSAAGLSADRFLSARLPKWSLARAAWAIRAGQVVSDRRALEPNSALIEGEQLTLLPPPAPRERPPMPPMPPVLYADAHVLALDKPPGLLMHPVGADFAWGLINIARHAFPEERLHLAHRLDRDTSGVCLLARSDVANVTLKAAFKAREVRKTYWAIVRGRCAWQQTRVDAPIGKDESSAVRIKMGLQEHGQPACTDFRVLHRARKVSLVSCRPHTGRTHQIRLHLASLGHPILGDRLYGQPDEVFLSLYEGRPCPDLRARLGHPRQCLHARALHLRGPDQVELHLRAPMPADMARVLQRA